MAKGRALPLRGGWWLLLAASLAVLALSLLVACDDDDGGEASGEGGGIEVTNARARFTTTDVGAVYFDIRSTGLGDRLVAASADVADDVQLHEIVSEGSTSMMQEVEDGIALDPGGRVSLQPGGYHLMVLGVDAIPEVGSTFEVVLEFEKAGRMTVMVHVQEFGADDADMDHGDMDDDR